LAHEQDGCSKSTLSNSKFAFDDLKKSNQSKTEYFLVKGGEAESDPCRSGHHMFYGASQEAYNAIDGFASSFYK
jgi:hypothetical protein